jgi:hypothetical protein
MSVRILKGKCGPGLIACDKRELRQIGPPPLKWSAVMLRKEAITALTFDRLLLS